MNPPKRPSPFFILPIIFILQALSGCNIPVVNSDPSEIPYHTKHFRIYYDPTVISPFEVEKISILKESILEHVNEYLGTSFDQVITTTISDTISANTHFYAFTFQTHEQARFAINDNGHEIAHVVSVHEWGNTTMNLLSEGVATAAQVRSYSTVIYDYSSTFWQAANRTAAVDTAMNHLYLNIVKNIFGYTYEEFIQAGAFVEFLRATYGINNVAAWWHATVNTSEDSPDAVFYSIFNDSLTNVIADFGMKTKEQFP